MRVKFFFSAHSRKEDFAQFENEFANCDVYIPEVTLYSRATIEKFRKLSCGKLSPKKIIQALRVAGVDVSEISSLDKSLWEIIYKSQKAIYLVDVPEANKTFKKIYTTAYKFDNLAFTNFLSGNFSKALENEKIFLELFTQYQKKREQYIKKNIYNLESKIIKDYPKLKNKKEINILISLGAAHTSLFHQLKKENRISVQRICSPLPIIFPIFSELERKKIFHYEQKNQPSKQDLSRILLEETLGLALQDDKNIKDTNDLSKISRHIAFRYNWQQIRFLSETLGKKYPEISLKSVLYAGMGINIKWKKFLKPLLKEFGIKLPKTRKEVKQIINKVERKI